MKYIYPVISAVGLVLLLVPAIMRFSGSIEPEQMKNIMLAGTVVWFAGAIPWLGKKTREGEN